MLWLPAFGDAETVKSVLHGLDNLVAWKQSAAISPTSYDQFIVTQCAADPSIVAGTDWLGVSSEPIWVAAAKRE